MTREIVSGDKRVRSEITDELDRIREKRTSLQKSKPSETNDVPIKPLRSTKQP